jgi:hypothetical protein
MSLFASRSLRVFTLLLVALATTGCFFSQSLEVGVFESDGDRLVSVSTTSTWTSCSSFEDETTYECAYFSEDGISRFGVSAIGLLFQLLIYDPLVLQVPQGASDFQASYSVQGGGGGALDVTSGQSTIRVDETRTLQAEPGMQFVIIDFPAGAPASGSGGFNFNFRLPNEVTTLDIKAVFTGKVTLEGETFYLPLFPCTSDIAALPTISVPLPNGGLVSLPVEDAAGCDGEVYTIVPTQGDFESTLLLPRLGK